MAFARVFSRLGAVSGASAVGLAAYGAHEMPKHDDEHRQKVFDIANKHHFLHSLVLLGGMRYCKYPAVAGSLVSAGMLAFCGSCYYQALTADARPRVITPYGGMLLIAGWLSLAI